jgi:GntR family transcriptional regulator/MocR family aminotransferase
VLPAALAPFLARVKCGREEQGDPAFEWAVADLIRDGELAAHLRRTRKVYESRRDLLVALLREGLGAHLNVEPPGGGMGLWIRVRPGMDVEAWVRAARAQGLVLNPPPHFFLEGTQPAFRMGFAQADEAELREAVARLARALPAR